MNSFDQRTAENIVAAIKKDGAAEAFFKSSSELRLEIIEAYMLDNIKKIEKLQTLYITNTEFKSNFRMIVLNQLKEAL